MPVFNEPTKYKVKITSGSSFKIDKNSGILYVVENGSEYQIGRQLTYIVS